MFMSAMFIDLLCECTWNRRSLERERNWVNVMNRSESIGCAAKPHGERPSSHLFVQKLFNHYLSLPQYLHPRNSTKKRPSPVYSTINSQTKYNITALLLQLFDSYRSDSKCKMQSIDTKGLPCSNEIFIITELTKSDVLAPIFHMAF